jgi:hypothetical protein
MHVSFLGVIPIPIIRKLDWNASRHGIGYGSFKNVVPSGTISIARPELTWRIKVLLVPKLRLGTPWRAKLRFGGGTPRVGGRAHRTTEWRGPGRAQTEFGHERAKMNPAPTERNKGGRLSCPVGAFHLPDHSTQGGARAPSTSSGPFGSLALGWLASGRWPDFWRDFQSNPASHPPRISPRFSPRTYRRS